MIKNRLKKLWAEGQPTLNGWLSIPSSFSAELLAEQAYDSITVDMQHGLIDYSDSVFMLQALRASDVVPIVRVPWLDAAAIMKALDAGAYGIICPMINTREQAEQFVSYMRYPPRGNRSFGPIRAGISGGANYPAEANDEVLCLAMIETAEAMQNLEDIVATPGLDGVYIGPADLTLGVANGRLAPGFDRQEPEMIEAIVKIQAAAAAAGIRSCLHCGTPEYAKRGADWGFNMLTLLNDARMLAAAAEHHVSRTRELLKLT
ncbi:MAG: hypothetical protein KTR32_05955 [Granulosicoccus sp.]|nr:hypothetical protein [Granulosicoccus sp.]